MTDERVVRFEKRRETLKTMSDEALKARFWELCQKAVEPMVTLAKTHTSPSIERSVLMRMGIDSLTAKGFVTCVQEAGLLGKGAGHCLLKVSNKTGNDLRKAAKAVLENKDLLVGLF